MRTLAPEISHENSSGLSLDDFCDQLIELNSILCTAKQGFAVVRAAARDNNRQQHAVGVVGASLHLKG